ncbi:MAG: hypothetical protein KGI50_06895 [Patescibacteria group bacterium]|nr:hypothetical protein [Patescibacteria group bacterium]MDE2438821.1 hypothetical protein [Patescibacteria group bacterium]
MMFPTRDDWNPNYVVDQLRYLLERCERSIKRATPKSKLIKDIDSELKRYCLREHNE